MSMSKLNPNHEGPPNNRVQKIKDSQVTYTSDKVATNDTRTAVGDDEDDDSQEDN